MADAKPSRPWRRFRRLFLAAGIAVAVGALTAAGSAFRVAWVAAGRQYTPENVPERGVGLVLGAKVDGPGQVSGFLSARLDVALDLFQRGKVRALLVSGDGYAESFYETREMKNYLVDRGVPANRVVEDVGGFDTYDSCIRTRDTFGIDEVTIITQDYHLPRAITVCEALGVDAIGVPDTTARQVYRGIWMRNVVREIPANLKMEWDLLLRRAPVQSDPPTDELHWTRDG